MSPDSRRFSGLFLVGLCMVALLIGGALLGAVDAPTLAGQGNESTFEPNTTGANGASGEGNRQGDGERDGDGESDGDSESDSDSESESEGDGSPDDGGGEPQSFDGDITFDIRVSEPVIPGETVTITVVQNGRPIEGVLVEMNGRRLGRTGEFGQVEATVPFDGELQLRAQKPAAREGSELSSLGAGTRLDRFGALAAPTAANDSDPIRENASVRTDITVVPLREPRAGEEVTFLARIDGTPIPEATVRQDGERVGTTNAQGRVTLEIPWRNATNVSVARGAASGSYRVTLAPLNVTTTTAGQLLLAAGLPATVQVTQDGRPVEGASVELANASAGTTDRAGGLTVELPRQSAATVAVTKGSLSASTRVTGLYTPYIVGGILLTLGVGALVTTVLLRSRFTSAAASGASIFHRVAHSLLLTVIRVARATASFLRAVRSTLAEVIERLRERDPAGALAALGHRIRAYLRSIPGRVRAALAGFLAGLPVVGTTDTPAETAVEQASVDTPTAASVTVREAFERVRERVPPPTETLTPAEVASRAIERGLPPDAVATITDAFRDVVYGERDPTAVSEPVSAAAETVERSVTESSGGEE
ncbi:DUF4129 domain-containing protein [Natronomonas sp. EA1]|uniref:DUF4129 domain-containing protein n=1 Tax=Natronomonas sp. EA1 TaxID=3421655 RepID=UPI003EB8B59E